jgi:hypothetical protein
VSEADETHCGCGGALAFDPLREGVTLGGLHLVGALVCGTCGSELLSRLSRPGGGWKLATSGRSIDAGGIRLRAEGAGGFDTPAVMARIARLPDLEAALRKIARGEGDAVAVAMAALEGK